MNYSYFIFYIIYPTFTFKFPYLSINLPKISLISMMFKNCKFKFVLNHN